jgi:hypothetical protein
MEEEGGGSVAASATIATTKRSKKPRAESTLDTLRECQTKLVGAQEKAERSAERLASAMDGRVHWLSDMALQETRQGFKTLEAQLSRLLRFTQERMMRVMFAQVNDVRRCEQIFVDQCVVEYMRQSVRGGALLEQPSMTQCKDAVLATIVIAGTARKKESTYVPPHAVFRIVYQPALSATYNNFEHVRVDYQHAARIFPDSVRYVMVDEYHAPPAQGVALSSKDEKSVMRAFKPSVASYTLYLNILPEITKGKKPELDQVPLGNEMFVLDDYVNFVNTCLGAAAEQQHITRLDNPLERNYLLATFQSFLIHRAVLILDTIHRKVQADNVDNFQCHYITPAFLQSVCTLSTGSAVIAEAFAVAEDHYQGKRRRVPPLRRSGKTRALSRETMHDDDDDDDEDDDDEEDGNDRNGNGDE